MSSRWLGALVLLAATSVAEAGDAFEVTRLARALPAQRPGQFLGRLGPLRACGGGLDEAGAPSAEVFVQVADDAWRRFTLRTPVAFAAATSGTLAERGRQRDTLFLVGGLEASGPTVRVRALQWQDGRLTEIDLPDLPVPLALAGAGFFEDQPQRQLYVVGGTTTGATAGASPRFFRCTFDGPRARGWEELPPLPEAGRLLPGVAALYNDLLVLGGCTVAHVRTASIISESRPGRVEQVAKAIEDDVCLPTRSALAFRWRPIDGTRGWGWRALSPMPLPLAGAAVLHTGQVHAAVVGGAGEPLADPRRTETAAGNDRVLVYHDVTDTWVEGGRLPAPLGPAAAARRGERWLLAGCGGAYELALRRTIRSLAAWDYLIIVGYFAAVAAAGIWYGRRPTSAAGFALGDRRVPWWMAGISMFATGASSISFVAIPAQSFRTSLIWAFPTLALVPLFFVEAYVIYPLIRRLDITSTYEYLERRFHPALRTIASAQAIALQVFGRMNMVLLLPAVAIAAVTGLDVVESVLLMGVLTTVYTAKGGLRAVVLTEVIQGLTVLAGVTLIIVLAITGLRGGFADFVSTSREFGRFELADWSLDWTAPVFWLIVLTPVLTKLGFAADQPLVQRVLATPLHDVRKLALVFLLCSVFISFAVNLAGISVFAWFRQHPAQLDPGMANDQVIPLYIVQRLPTGLAGLLIAALFASAASALAGSVNSVATLFTEDFYRKLRPHASDRGRLLTLRIASAVAGASATGAALFMATRNLRSLFQTWNELLALLGGGFLGISILGIFTRRANAIGAASGALASVAVTLLVKRFTPLHWYGYLPAAVLSCCAIGYLVSLVTPRPKQDLAGLTVFDPRPAATAEDAPAALRSARSRWARPTGSRPSTS